jgi:hypothetical protein
MAVEEEWPDILPLPTFEGYGIEPFDGVDRTEMEQGEARQTQNYTNVPDRRPVRWRFTQVQFAIFESWFKTKADRGAEWFGITLLSGLGMVEHEARFAGKGSSPYKATPIRGDRTGAKWYVTSTLEVRQPPTLDEEALDVILAEGGDFLGLIDSIEAMRKFIEEDFADGGGWGEV